MATNKELLEAKKRFKKLTPSNDPSSEYQTTLALIREAEAKRESARTTRQAQLSAEKLKKDAAKASEEKKADLALIKSLEDYIQRNTDLGQPVPETIQTQYNNLKKKYPSGGTGGQAQFGGQPTGYQNIGTQTVGVTPVTPKAGTPPKDGTPPKAGEKPKVVKPPKDGTTPPPAVKPMTINEIIDLVANKYGSIDTIFKTDPGLQALLRKAIGKDGVPNTDDDLTPDQFVKELENTDWFKTNANAVRQRGFYKRQFDDLVASGSDPEDLYKTTEYGRGLKNAQQVIADEIVRVGGNLSPEDIELLARDIYDLGYENQKAIVSQRIRAKISYKPGGIVSGEAGEKLAELKKTAKANGLDLEKNFGDSIQGWLEKLAQGESVETFKQIIRGSAKIGLPEKVSALLDQGVDLDTVYNPYKRLMASVLEINPESITLDDSVLRSAIGPDKEMSLYDFQKMLKKDNRWQYTNQAKEEVSNTALRVLRDFGFQG
jgi:hypothetical protein